MSRQLISVGLLDNATYFFGGMLVLQGIVGQVCPQTSKHRTGAPLSWKTARLTSTVAKQFGLSVPTLAHATYLPIWASRNMLFGLTLIIFAYQRQRKASGVLFLLAGLIGGPSDLWYVAQDGAEKGMLVAHVVASVLVTTLGRALYLS